MIIACLGKVHLCRWSYGQDSRVAGQARVICGYIRWLQHDSMSYSSYKPGCLWAIFSATSRRIMYNEAVMDMVGLSRDLLSKAYTGKGQEVHNPNFPGKSRPSPQSNPCPPPSPTLGRSPWIGSYVFQRSLRFDWN